MNPETGNLYKVERESEIKRGDVPISKQEYGKVKAMSIDDRKAYAKRVLKNRAKRKRAKKSKRRNR